MLGTFATSTVPFSLYDGLEISTCMMAQMHGHSPEKFDLKRISNREFRVLVGNGVHVSSVGAGLLVLISAICILFFTIIANKQHRKNILYYML